ncbi:hypothetical protein D9613_011100 [Agrocybe pediades]|uniref:Beta-lactamase-related domain-containing protein n=1 Tax=Agrocybe pediades TaxID=84607 RepID=A0A8H4QLN1_9AGAR|nr:hypothetical protein D9613_011100 [Agrocybe pediades]
MIGKQEQAIKDKNLPSLTLGISNVDGEIYFNGGGPQLVNDPGSGEVNPDSVFWICSQTKMIASLALLKLVELGQVSYDTQVGDYLPQLRDPIIIKSRKEFEPCKTPITVKHLLNFSSGLFYPASAEGPQALPVGYTDKDMHVAEDPIARFFRLVQRNLPGVPVKFEPGTDFVYGWSADIMGFLVEKVTKQTFEQFCKEHIFGPLNMDTSFRLTPELRRRLVHLAYRNPNSNGLDSFTTQMNIMEQDPSKVGLYLGGVGLYSSMRDYLKLLRHLMRINAGLHVPNPILSTRTVREMFVPALTEKGSQSLSELVMAPGTQWGTTMALVTRDWPKRRKQGSAFWGGWAGTQHFIDPASGIAVVFGVQVAPTADPLTSKLWLELEALIYSALNSANAKL